MKYSHVTDDSRKVQPGSLFVAIKGDNFDGNDYIEDAIKKGAAAIVSEEPPKIGWPSKIEYIKVKDARQKLSELASEFYGKPSEKLKVIGVTGSDGKTTTSHMIYEILKKANKKVGLISTIAARINEKEIDTGFHVTNPEPLALHKFLKDMVDSGIEYAVIEVTSHGIAQKRVSSVHFDIAVLTNITHEHIDYHKTFENYRDTKLELFLNAKASVLNSDDENYDYFKNKIKGKIISYSLKDKKDLKINKLMGEDLDKIGEYNIQNALAAAAVGKELGVSTEDINLALSGMNSPKGRLEKIKNGKGVEIYIDFAHTPNSLKNVLSLLRKNTKGNLIAVFGCASERDDQKRPMMAKISTDIADISVFTAEDPRREDINKIFTEMEKGVEKKNAKYFKVPERGEAISKAINEFARPGDTVVICGKAHETSMAYNGVEYPWSDFEAVETALKGEVLKINRS
jgi:UDP-N-acetylmuramoyl-L-alanyl-D-glutamate--2,6-diaminopimelate ligase